jgi:hypothetical protein
VVGYRLLKIVCLFLICWFLSSRGGETVPVSYIEITSILLCIIHLYIGERCLHSIVSKHSEFVKHNKHAQKICCSWSCDELLPILSPPNPRFSCSYSDLLQPLCLDAVVVFVDITTVQAIVITAAMTFPAKGTVAVRSSCLFSQRTSMGKDMHPIS